LIYHSLLSGQPETTMKKLNQLFITGALLVVMFTTSHAQTSATATATANANVIHPISLQWQTPLAFGILIPPPTSTGTAVMDVSTISGLNSLNYLPKNPDVFNGVTRTNGASPGPIIFLVEGELGYTYSISLPPVTTPVIVYINNTSGPDQLLLDNFQTNIGSTGVLNSVVFGTLGKQYFAVGATLHIPSTAGPGQYSGQFTCTVAYN